MSKLSLNDFSHEEHQIYRDILHAHTIEDVRSRCPKDTSIEILSDIASRAQDIISKNDSYFEAYWLSIEAAVEEAGIQPAINNEDADNDSVKGE